MPITWSTALRTSVCQFLGRRDDTGSDQVKILFFIKSVEQVVLVEKYDALGIPYHFLAKVVQLSREGVRDPGRNDTAGFALEIAEKLRRRLVVVLRQ